MATQSEGVTLKIAAQTKQLEAANKRIAKQLGLLEKRANKHLGAVDRRYQKTGKAALLMASQVKKAGGVIAAAFSVAGFAKLRQGMKGLTDEMDKIGKSAKRLNVGTQSLQVLHLAALFGGSEPAAVEKSVAKITKAISESNDGVATYADSFKELGVATANADGTQRASLDVLRELGEKYQSAADKSRALAQIQILLGTKGIELITVLENIGTAQDNAWKTSFSEENIKRAEAANDRIALAWKEAKSAGQDFAVEFLETWATVVEELTAAMRFLSARSRLQSRGALPRDFTSTEAVVGGAVGGAAGWTLGKRIGKALLGVAGPWGKAASAAFTVGSKLWDRLSGAGKVAAGVGTNAGKVVLGGGAAAGLGAGAYYGASLGAGFSDEAAAAIRKEEGVIKNERMREVIERLRAESARTRAGGRGRGEAPGEKERGGASEVDAAPWMQYFKNAHLRPDILRGYFSQSEQDVKADKVVISTEAAASADAIMRWLGGESSGKETLGNIIMEWTGGKDAGKQFFQHFFQELLGGLGLGGEGGLGALAGNLGGGLGGGLTSLFGGGGFSLGGLFKQHGGLASAGGPYIVGERGPELFMPRHSGSVFSAGQTRGMSGGGITVAPVFNIQSADGPGVRAAIDEVMPQIVQTAKSAVAADMQRPSHLRTLARGQD